MKTSIRRFRGFGIHRHEPRERRVVQPHARLDELLQASEDLVEEGRKRGKKAENFVRVGHSKAASTPLLMDLHLIDMQEMRNCYDSLLSAAAATANSAFEFSESLKEMGACLLEKNALNDDEESGKVLLMLGKVQYELQKLVDRYRSHIFQTIVTPSESLLKELRTVEEMKRQCDEKRDVYEYMVTRQREKGRLRSGRGETFSSDQVQAACDEYDEEANLFVFRLKSLKQGQSRSLLTQASRHHAAQLFFFRKAHKSLEEIEPHVKLVTDQQHIDYKFSGLEDDDGDDGEDDDDDYDNDAHDGDLSFDYGQTDHELDFVSTARNSMELDQEDITFPQVATVHSVKENLDKSYVDSFSINEESRKISQSAPLFAEKKFDSAWMRQIRPLSTNKLRTYVLPTPDDTKSSTPTKSDILDSRPMPISLSGQTNTLWHSSPLQPKYEKILGDHKVFESTAMNSQSVLRESNANHAVSGLPPSLSDRLPFQLRNPGVSDTKKVKRYAFFSGPLPRNQWSSKPGLSASDPSVPVRPPELFSGPLLRTQMPRMSSSSPPRASPTASPFSSSPKISELHELPRPPASSRPSSLIGHSAPLIASGPNLSATNKLVVSSAASPLPLPLQAVPRSFSTPSIGQKLKISPVSEPSEASQDLGMTENVNSPPLTPISLSSILPTSSSSVNNTSQLEGDE